jgi:uncharacterized protein YmfQ (DUF2313 family)
MSELDTEATLAAAYLPPGLAFASKLNSASNLSKLFRGFGRTFLTVRNDVDALEEHLPPDRTVKFLEEWERDLEIPDQCIPLFETADERRAMILLKLTAMNIQTNADFVALAAAFGITVTVEGGIVSFNDGNPHAFSDETEARYTIVITFVVDLPESFPYTFPITFGNETLGILQCLFTKLKPANCQVLFVGI